MVNRYLYSETKLFLCVSLPHKRNEQIQFNDRYLVWTQG